MTRPEFYLPKPQPIQATNIAKPVRHPEEVTFRFARFTKVGMTGYQRNQHAGFLRTEAEEMQARGLGVIVEGV